MKMLVTALVSAAAFIAYPSFALEPWHDYYTAKAMKEKAAKKRLAKAEAETDQRQTSKDKKDSNKEDKKK